MPTCRCGEPIVNIPDYLSDLKNLRCNKCGSVRAGAITKVQHHSYNNCPPKPRMETADGKMTCRDCGTEKPLDEFPMRGGIRTQPCLECRKRKGREYYHARKARGAE